MTFDLKGGQRRPNITRGDVLRNGPNEGSRRQTLRVY